VPAESKEKGEEARLCQLNLKRREWKGGASPRSEDKGGDGARRWRWSGVTQRGGRVGRSRGESE
jgi:hypothetical protein